MERGKTRTPEQIADGIAYVCEHIGHIRATLERGPAQGIRQFDELLAALRDGAAPADLLVAVHRALRTAQDALGIFGDTRDASALNLIGTPDLPREPVLLCPRPSHPCARYACPAPGSTPVCHVTGAPLRRAALAP